MSEQRPEQDPMVERVQRAFAHEEPATDVSTVLRRAARHLPTRESHDSGQPAVVQRSAPKRGATKRAYVKPAELEEIYLQHRDMMWRIAQTLLKGQTYSSVSAEDVVAQVMVEAYERGLPSDPEAETSLDLGVYLRRMVVARAIDALRKAKRSAAPVEAALAADPVATVEEQDLLRRVDLLLKYLTPKERFVFIERVRKGRSTKAVAQELGVTPPRVAQLVTAALRKLRDQLVEESTEAS